MKTTACPWEMISPYSIPVHQCMLIPTSKAAILRIWQPKPTVLIEGWPGIWKEGRSWPFLLQPKVPKQIIIASIYMALNIYQTLLKSLYIHSISSFNAYNNSISYVLLSSFYTWRNKAHKDRKTWVEPLRQAFKPRQPAVESSWEHFIELTLMKENNGCLVWGKIVALYQ